MFIFNKIYFYLIIELLPKLVEFSLLIKLCFIVVFFSSFIYWPEKKKTSTKLQKKKSTHNEQQEISIRIHT